MGCPNDVVAKWNFPTHPDVIVNPGHGSAEPHEATRNEPLGRDDRDDLAVIEWGHLTHGHVAEDNGVGRDGDPMTFGASGARNDQRTALKAPYRSVRWPFRACGAPIDQRTGPK